MNYEQIKNLLISNNEIDKTYIGAVFDNGFVDNYQIREAIQGGIPESPSPLEILGLLVLDSLASYKTALTYPELINSENGTEGGASQTQNTPIKNMLDSICLLIDSEDYEGAMMQINETRRVCGSFPDLDSLQTEIEMIEFLADTMDE